MALSPVIRFKHFRKDLLGGITAGIVALPLALAFGEQSGLGAASGLYGAAFIAFFAALFGGTPTQISGPTAPMTALSMVIVASLLQSFEGKQEQAMGVILFVFLLAGLFQILLGVFKMGSFVKYIPHTVVSGFMTGIGVIILITQMLPALGYYSVQDETVVHSFLPEAEELILERILVEEAEDGILVLEEFNETIARANSISEEDIKKEALILAANDSRGVLGSIEYLGRALRAIHWTEFILTFLTILIIYGFKRVTRVVPSTLIALIVVSGGAYFLKLDYMYIQEIPSGYPIFHTEIFTNWNFNALAPFIFSALMLAFLGSIDSLLTSIVADNMTKTRHRPNKELIGQGIGNSVAALFGGLPGAGATIRTVVNIQAGGRTKLSGMIAGLLLISIILMFGPIASIIPAGVLAGILITVGIGVIDFRGLKALPKMEPSEKSVLIIVLVLTVFWQLVYAVAVGLVLASIVFLKRMGDLSARRIIIKNLSSGEEYEPLWRDEENMRPDIKDKVLFKHLSGPLFFGMVSEFRNIFSGLGDLHLLIIRMEKVPFIDQSGIYALEEAISQLRNRKVIVGITGLNQKSEALLRTMKVVPNLIHDDHIFKNFEECRMWLRSILMDENALESEIEKYLQA